MVSMALLELTEIKEFLDHKDQPESLARLAELVEMEKMESEAVLEMPEQLDPMVPSVNQDLMESLVQWE